VQQVGADVEVMRQGGRVQDFMPERKHPADAKSASNKAEPAPYKSAYGQELKKMMKKKKPSTAAPAKAEMSPRRTVRSQLTGRQVSPTRA